MSAAQGSIVVRAPVGDVYRQWLRVEDFPKFMPAVKEVASGEPNAAPEPCERRSA